MNDSSALACSNLQNNLEKSIWKRQSTEKESDQLRRELGLFSRWNDLVPELKSKVVTHMDYLTRTKLSLCSRSDHDIVSSTPLTIHSIAIKDNGQKDFFIEEPYRRHKYVSVRVVFHNESVGCPELSLNFIKRGENTVCNRDSSHQYKLHSHIIPRRNYYQEAVGFAEKLLEKSRYSVKSMTIEMKRWPLSDSTVQFMGHCTKLRVCSDDENLIKWWIEKIPLHSQCLQLCDNVKNISLSSEFLAIEHLTKTEQLQVWCHSNFTEEQFLNLSANRMNLHSNTITDRAINQFIQNWASGKLKKDFLACSVFMNRETEEQIIIENLSVRPWDEKFEKEFNGLCDTWDSIMGRSSCYQVKKRDDSGMTATLNISNNSVMFIVTGKLPQAKLHSHLELLANMFDCRPDMNLQELY